MNKMPILNFPTKIKEIDFGSGTRNTPDFVIFMRTVHGDFEKMKNAGIITDYKVKTGHFYFYVFITANDENKSVYYLSSPDTRGIFDGGKYMMLIRRAKDYKDYTGGSNNYIALGDTFLDELILFLLMNSTKTFN